MFARTPIETKLCDASANESPKRHVSIARITQINLRGIQDHTSSKLKENLILKTFQMNQQYGSETLQLVH